MAAAAEEERGEETAATSAGWGQRGPGAEDGRNGRRAWTCADGRALCGLSEASRPDMAVRSEGRWDAVAKPPERICLGSGGHSEASEATAQDCPLPAPALRTPAPLVRADEPGARPSSSSAPENFRPSPGPRRHRHRRAPTGRRSRCSPPTALPRPHRDRDRDHLPTARPLISTALALPPPSGLLLAPFLRSQPRFARAPLPASDPSRLESPLPDHPRRHPRLLPSSTHISSTAQPSPRARTPSPPSHSLAAG